MADDKELEIQLQFLDEAEDHLQTLETVFMGLSSSRVDGAALNGALRAAHSMKGGGSLMGFPVLSQLSHRLEDGMKVLKIQKDSVNIDDRLEYLLLSAVDCLRSVIDDNRQQTSPSPDWVTHTANPIFDELYDLLGEPTEEDAESVLSPEDGADILPILFETEVEGCLQRIENLLATPDKPCLYEELLILAQELGGLGAMLQLDAFCHLCASIAYALQADPTRTLDIAQVAVIEWRRSQSLVLTQQIDLLPRTIEVPGLDIRLAPNLDPTDFLAMVPVSHGKIDEDDQWMEDKTSYAQTDFTKTAASFDNGELDESEFIHFIDDDLEEDANGQGLPDDVFSTAHGISFHIRSREDSDQPPIEADVTPSGDIFERLSEHASDPFPEQSAIPLQADYSPPASFSETDLLSELFPIQEPQADNNSISSEVIEPSDTEFSDAEFPNTEFSNVNLSDVEMPSAEMPSAEMLSAEMLSAEMLSAEMLSAEVGDAEVGDTDMADTGDAASDIEDDTLGALDVVIIQDWGEVEEDASDLAPDLLEEQDSRVSLDADPSWNQGGDAHAEPLSIVDDSDDIFTELDALLSDDSVSSSSSAPSNSSPTDAEIDIAMDAPTEPSIFVDAPAIEENGTLHPSKANSGANSKFNNEDEERLSGENETPLAPLNEIDIWDVDDAQQPFNETCVDEVLLDDAAVAPLDESEDSEPLDVLGKTIPQQNSPTLDAVDLDPLDDIQTSTDLANDIQDNPQSSEERNIVDINRSTTDGDFLTREPDLTSTANVLEGLDALGLDLEPVQEGSIDEAPLEDGVGQGNLQEEWTLDGLLDDFSDPGQPAPDHSLQEPQEELLELDDWLAEVEEWSENINQNGATAFENSDTDGTTVNEIPNEDLTRSLSYDQANSDNAEVIEQTTDVNEISQIFDDPLETTSVSKQDDSVDISQIVPPHESVLEEGASSIPLSQPQNDQALPMREVDPEALTPEPKPPYRQQQVSDPDPIAPSTLEPDPIAIQTNTLQTESIQTESIQTESIQTSTIQTSTIQTSTIQTRPESFAAQSELATTPRGDVTAMEKASASQEMEATEFQLLNPTSSGVLPADENENTFVRVGSKHLNQLNDLFGELTIDRNGLTLHLKRLRGLVKTLNRRVKLLDQANTQLRAFYDQGATVTADGIPQAEGPYTVTSSHMNSLELERRDPDLDSVALGLDNQFDALEMDNYSDLHHLFQAVMEGMVQIQEVAEDLDLNLDDSEQSSRNLNKTARQLQIELMHVRMRPLSDIANRFPRALRELSLKHKKPVEFKLHGGNTLIDRTILDSLGEPLMHLVRNAFDHGIEDKATRQANGKPEVATVEIRASHQGNRTIISISDDGHGIALDKIRNRARQMGLDEMLLAAASEQELLSLIFEPGFSTAAKTTDLSGRGVGMDVVRDRLQHIHGDIKISTRAGKGTTFTLSVPLTLSVTRVLLAESNGMLIAIPTDTVDEMIMLEPEQIMTTVGREVFEYDGKMAELIRLDQWLHFYCPRTIPEPLETQASIKVPSVLIVKRGNQITGLEVERSWSEQEVTVRRVVGVPPMPDGFSSCTILGDGRVVPLVNIPALMHWVMSNQRTTPTVPLSSPPSPERPMNPTLFSSTMLPSAGAITNQRSALDTTTPSSRMSPSEPLALPGSVPSSIATTSSEQPGSTGVNDAQRPSARPFAPPPPPPTTTRQRPYPTAPDPSTYYLLNQKPQILIVDDSIAVRRLLALTLEKASYRVEQAKDGQDALEKLNTGLQIDAMICDIEMPRLDGYRLLAKMKSSARLKHVPVMMLTSRSGEKHRKLAMSLGAIAYFTKPYNEQLLVQRLADIAHIPV